MDYHDTNLRVRDYSPRRVIRGIDTIGPQKIEARSRVATLETGEGRSHFRGLNTPEARNLRTSATPDARKAQVRNVRMDKSSIEALRNPASRAMSPAATGAPSDRSRSVRNAQEGPGRSSAPSAPTAMTRPPATKTETISRGTPRDESQLPAPMRTRKVEAPEAGGSAPVDTHGTRTTRTARPAEPTKDTPPPTETLRGRGNARMIEAPAAPRATTAAPSTRSRTISRSETSAPREVSPRPSVPYKTETPAPEPRHERTIAPSAPSRSRTDFRAPDAPLYTPGPMEIPQSRRYVSAPTHVTAPQRPAPSSFRSAPDIAPRQMKAPEPLPAPMRPSAPAPQVQPQREFRAPSAAPSRGSEAIRFRSSEGFSGGGNSSSRSRSR